MLYSLIPFIEDTPLFTGVPKDHTNKFLNEQSISVRAFSQNSLAYSSKCDKPQVAIILEGAARVFTGTESENALLRTLTKGDIFGVANLYDTGNPFPSRIVTAVDSKIIFIDGVAFKKYIENNSIATKNYLAFLSGRIVFLNKKLATLTAGSAEKKLAAYISEHSVDGIFTAGSLSELAGILQMGRASLYRSIDILTECGLIKKQGKTFTVLELEKLKNL